MRWETAMGSDTRIGAALLILCTVICALLTKAVWLKTVEGPKLADLGDRQSYRLTLFRGRRGRILDRNGSVLAMDVPTAVVALIPSRMPSSPSRRVALAAQHLREVEDNVGPCAAERHTLEAVLRGDCSVRPYAALTVGIDPDRIDWARAYCARYPYLRLEHPARYRRIYPYRPVAMPLLGWVRPDGHPGEGLEMFHSRTLRSQDKEFLAFFDAARRGPLHPMPQWGPEEKDGADVQLSLDICLQAELESLLSSGLKLPASRQASSTWGRDPAERQLGRPTIGHWASCIVLDPSTGEILSMVSLPSDDADPRLISDDPNGAMPRVRNRTVQELLRPGRGLSWLLACHLFAGADLKKSLKAVSTETLVLEDSGRTWSLLEKYLVGIEQAQLLTQYAILDRADKLGLRSRTGVDLLGESKNLLIFDDNAIDGRHYECPEGERSMIPDGFAVTTLGLAVAFARSVHDRPDLSPTIVSRESTTPAQQDAVRRPASRWGVPRFWRSLSCKRLILAGTGEWSPVGRDWYTGRFPVTWAVGCGREPDAPVVAVALWTGGTQGTSAQALCVRALEILRNWTEEEKAND